MILQISISVKVFPAKFSQKNSNFCNFIPQHAKIQSVNADFANRAPTRIGVRACPGSPIGDCLSLHRKIPRIPFRIRGVPDSVFEPGKAGAQMTSNSLASVPVSPVQDQKDPPPKCRYCRGHWSGKGISGTRNCLFAQIPWISEAFPAQHNQRFSGAK